MKEKVYHYLTLIPSGRVATYGQIAKYLGNQNFARTVGNILHANPDPDKYPCYKVVNSKGKLAKHYAYGGLEAQRRRLQTDGIAVVNDAVDLKKYGYENASED